MEVEQKLDHVLSLLPVKILIMGWARDNPTSSLYEKTAAYCEKKNIAFYLWFPVFSENSLIRSLDGLVDFHGEKILAADSHNSGDEDFSFCCPNNTHNIEKILDIFESEFSVFHFDGIFLDKIRYPSSANNQAGKGLNTMFSCSCDFCMAKYKKADFDAGALIATLTAALKSPAASPISIKGILKNGEYDFYDPLFSRFFSLKGEFIKESLEHICTYFREKKLKIGFDVFAPFLSPFVGQNLTSLSTLCDFIKPMMYRATNAPAGLPFETEALLRESSNFFDYTEIIPGALEAPASPFDLDFTARDLEKLVKSSSCPVYAGFEINRKENISNVHPAYIEETMRAYAKAGSQGFVLSWDLMDAPKENILKVAEVIKIRNNEDICC